MKRFLRFFCQADAYERVGLVCACVVISCLAILVYGAVQQSDEAASQRMAVDWIKGAAPAAPRYAQHRP